MTVELTYTPPINSEIYNHVSNYHYCDSFSVVVQTALSVDEITKIVFDIPQWVKKLLNLRNFLVKPFGLYIPTEKELQKRQKLPFMLIERYPEELIMGEKDKHLNFWVSVQKTNDSIILTTLVHFNNRLGRLYFFPVKPFHKLIVRKLLKRFNSIE